jgi:hypothetical protein
MDGIETALDRARAMPSLHTSTTEVYLLVEQPRQQLSHLSRVLAVLDAAGAPPIMSALAHYDSSCDVAVLQLSYERSTLDALALRYVVNVALAANVGMIQPDALSQSQRKRFVEDRLARCAIRSSVQRTTAGALTALVRSIAPVRAASKPPPIPLRALATPPPELPFISAKGTRDKLSTPPVTQEPDDESDRITSRITVRAPAAIAADSRPPRIDARYRRAGRWASARVVAIGMNGAALEATLPPRLYDDTELELRFGQCCAVVQATVANVSTLEGATVFTVKFALDDQSREHLFGLLLAAREAKLTIKLPAACRSSSMPR